ncbi:MAG: 16S rRNA (cytidine(1402)-2'-O)-methyltransferase [Dehalococcoidales bacterium]|nr:16S rRNA (cytidine(1402)-2'-O)-methyltransferase [Dehalococcoidales bacterium]
MPTLYVVATPIGNLADISRRAIETLRTVKLIAAEDTRKTRILLNACDISTPMTSYFEHNKRLKLDYLLNFLETGDVALVSEAGMPGISDPGHELIVAASEKGIPVVPIPGPSVVVTALAVSGLPPDRFTFLGFLPRKSGERRRLLETMTNDPATLIFFEAPHRLHDTLDDMLLVLGNRRIAACREMTKIHEEVFRGTISQAIEHFTNPRGEFTLVIEGQKEVRKPEMNDDIESSLRELRRSGVPAKEAISSLSGSTGLSKKELYRVWIKAG